MFRSKVALIAALLLTAVSLALSFPQYIGLKQEIRLENIREEKGFCRIAPLPDDRWSVENGPSGAILYENAVQLWQGSALHDDIRGVGHGQYSFWQNSIYFSSSDGSDPLKNGRIYTAVGPNPLLRKIGLVSLFISFFLWLAIFYYYRGEINGTLFSQRKTDHLGYRPEIDGLRALALIPVILFHAGNKWFQGGYIGVDIFFVISGYLITTLIANEEQAGKFSIKNFYERRARRILPALFFVMLSCLPFAWFYMMPSELKDFSQGLIAVTTFIPNIFFSFKTGYFARNADENPLLHTWSLGVEEQFYILFPILFILLWRLRRKQVIGTILFLACISLGLGEWKWRHGQADTNFFFASSRAWELLTGALIALISISRPIHERVTRAASAILSLVGFSMIIFAIIFYDKATPFPSLYGLVPVIGTALIISFAHKDTFLGRFFSIKWIAGIGLISYSAYLWHQPLFAFARIYSISDPSAELMTFLSLVSLLLAYISWRYIEKPFRDRRNFNRSTIFKMSLIGSLFFVFIGTVASVSNGFENRFPKDFEEAADRDKLEKYQGEKFFSLNANFSNSDYRKILILGDSYSEDLVNAITENHYLADDEIRTIFIDVRCQMYKGNEDVSEFIDKQDRSFCINKPTLASSMQIIRKADVIIMAGNWKKWAAERLPVTISNLQLTKKQQLFIARILSRSATA
jgi:peptidoglycan/LPS O-acetylase OafA/YrhL